MSVVLVTGGKGQLAQCLKDAASSNPDHEFHFFDKAEWDITSRLQTDQILGQYTPDYVINTAAYTAVDKSELEIESCFAINDVAVGQLAQSCKDHDTHLIHISSDYVYDNATRKPLREDALCTPKSVYGKSKLQGDQRIVKLAHSATIIRTSWVYSAYGHNFVKTMLRLSKTYSDIKVVQDQWGCPTSAHDLARILVEMINEQLLDDQGTEIIHFTNDGLTNWYEFANEIFSLIGKEISVTPITTEAFGAAAPRPVWSIMNCDKYDSLSLKKRRHWKAALAECLKILGAMS